MISLAKTQASTEITDYLIVAERLLCCFGKELERGNEKELAARRQGVV